MSLFNQFIPQAIRRTSRRNQTAFLVSLLSLSVMFSTTCFGASRLKTIAHFSGLQENPITGYGLVIGLAGTGDSRRSKDTTQSIANLLQSFGVNVNPKDINSRNTAAVMLTANLPEFAHSGDKLDVNVASLGDAKSLLGGTLLAAPMKGPDNQIYALAQGPLSIGGFKYDAFGNVVQKNHPTTGIIPGGAIVERSLPTEIISKDGGLKIILNRPDFTTADHVQRAVNKAFGMRVAVARGAQVVDVYPPKESYGDFIHFISRLESIEVETDKLPTVVINERTGVVVAGSDVRIDSVTISHGNLQISISTSYQVSQPITIGNTSPAIKSVIVPQTEIKAQEQLGNNIELKEGATVGELITALAKVRTTTRDMISILQSLKRADALHAELILQ